MAAVLRIAVRQALRQQLKGHAVSSSSVGIPGHLPQVNLISLQSGFLSNATTLSEDSRVWSFYSARCLHDYKGVLATPAQHARGMAEQASQGGKKDMPDQAAVPGSKPTVQGKKDQPAVSGNRPAGPVSHARGGMIKAVFISPNVLMEPYKGPGMRLPFLQSWFTLLGWRARKERTMSSLKSMYAIAKLKKNIKGFGLRTFKQEALQVYTETCQLLAEGDQSRLRQATTPALFDNMKREIKARQEGGWKSVRWSMLNPPKLGQMDIVHGRIMAQNPKDDKTAWVQLTVTIPSEQTFAAYNGKRALVAGSPDKPIKVVDTWVFERALKKDPSTRWRCAGRISLQPPSQTSAAVSKSSDDHSDPSRQPTAIRQVPAPPRSKRRIQAATAAM